MCLLFQLSSNHMQFYSMPTFELAIKLCQSITFSLFSRQFHSPYPSPIRFPAHSPSGEEASALAHSFPIPLPIPFHQASRGLVANNDGHGAEPGQMPSLLAALAHWHSRQSVGSWGAIRVPLERKAAAERNEASQPKAVVN